MAAWQRLDLREQVFDLLTAKEDIGPAPKKRGRLWRCICACGKEHIARAAALRAGHVGSCGCRPGRKRKQRWCEWCGDELVKGVYRYCNAACRTEGEVDEEDRLAKEGQDAGLTLY